MAEGLKHTDSLVPFVYAIENREEVEEHDKDCPTNNRVSIDLEKVRFIITSGSAGPVLGVSITQTLGQQYYTDSNFGSCSTKSGSC